MAKFLAIDDNRTNLILLKKLLSENFKDAEVLIALDGNEGIELAKTQQPDTILLDIHMPDIDGFEVCKQLKSDLSTQHIPILFVTAVYDDTASRIYGLELGAEGFISKPFNIGELIAKVKVMLRIKKAEDRMRAENIQLEELVEERTKKLAESEEFYRLLFTHLNSGFAIHELVKDGKGDIIDTKIIEANQMFCNIFNTEDASGKLLSDVFSEEDPYWLITYLKVAITGKSEKFTRYSQFLDKFLEVSVYSPQKGRFVTIFDDISKRVRAEAQVLYEKAYFEQLFQSAPEAIVLTTNDHFIQSVNSAFTRIFGYENQEIQNKSINDILTNEQLMDEALNISNSVANGEEVLKETIRKRKDGKLINVSILGAPIIINKKQEGIFGIYRDISDRKRIEAELHDAYDFNNILIEESPVGIMVFETDGLCIMANTAAISILQAETSTKLIQRNITDYDHAKGSGLAPRLHEVVRTNKSLNETINIQSLKDKPLWLDVYFVPVVMQSKNRIMLMFRDVTQLKEHEVQVERNLEQQLLISSIAYELNKSDSFEASLYAVLQFLGKYTKARHTKLIEDYPEGIDNYRIIDWSVNEHPLLPEIKIIKDENIAHWKEYIRKEGKIMHTSAASLSNETISYFENYKNSALLVLPIVVFGSIHGLLCFEDDITHQSFEKYDPTIFSTATNIIANSLERKKIADILRSSEEKFRQLSENIEDAVILIQNKDVLYVNPATSKISGLDEQVIYSDPRLLLHLIENIDTSELIGFMNNLKPTEHYSRELLLKKNSDIQRWIWLRVFPIFDDKGNAYRKVAIVSEITDRKEIESQIMKTIIKTEEKEKKRFSEDLHDGLGPLLSSIKLYINLLATKNKAEPDPAENLKLLKFVEDLVDEAILNTKDIANDLTPNLLNDYGLIQAVKYFCEKLNDSKIINVKYSFIPEDTRLESDLEINLYRIIKELINNSLKHAKASVLTINLTINKQIYLQYSDNGKGFELDKVLKDKNAGLGMRNITNRVKAINGKIQINTAPGEGLNVEIKV